MFYDVLCVYKWLTFYKARMMLVDDILREPVSSKVQIWKLTKNTRFLWPGRPAAVAEACSQCIDANTSQLDAQIHPAWETSDPGVTSQTSMQNWCMWCLRMQVWGHQFRLCNMM